MKSIFRSVCGRSVNIIRQCQPRRLLPRCAVVYGVKGSSHLCSLTGGENSPPSLKIQAWTNQIVDFKLQYQKSKDLRWTIYDISRQIVSVARRLLNSLWGASYNVLEEAKEHITLLREHYNELAEIIQELSPVSWPME